MSAKKIIFGLVLITIISISLPSAVWGDENGIKIIKEPKGAPSFITGKLPKLNRLSPEGAVNYLKENSSAFGLTGDLDFQVIDTKKDELGMTHFKMQQYLNNIPIYGKQAVVHLDKNNEVKVINGKFKNGLKKTALQNKARISPEDALRTASENVGAPQDNVRSSARLMWYEHNDKLTLTYVIDISFLGPQPGNWRVFVDASNGKILHKYNRINKIKGSGIGVLGDTKQLEVYRESGVYYLWDTTRKIKTFDIGYRTSGIMYLFYDYDGFFNSPYQAPAVDGHYYAGKARDYFYSEFGRNSFDGSNAQITVVIHYGYNYDNAFWDGYELVFGDGDGIYTRPFTAGLDVVAHEFTHAVIDYTCDLEDEYQPGAVKESLADTFGQLIERKYKGDQDWLICEDIDLNGTITTSLQDPSLYGQPSHMSNYYNVPFWYDNGGVHINSGIPNKAAYLIASQMGDKKTGKIYYRAMCYYLTDTSDFTDFRNALIHSAIDLYPAGNEPAIVRQAFDQVGITDTSAPSTPAGLTAVAGNAQVKLSWPANTDEDLYGYNIYKSQDNLTYTKINGTAPVTTTSYTATGLTNGTTYYFKISAVDFSNNESSPTDAVHATPNGPPAAPTNLVGTANSPFSITWTWQDNSTNETGFRIYDASGTLIGTVGANVCTFTESNLNPYTSYNRVIKSYNEISESAGAKAKLRTPKFAGPSNLTASVEPTAITWTWADNLDFEDGFRLYDSSGNLIASVDSNVTSYRETGLTPNTSYRRYVVAHCNGIQSTKSKTITAKTPEILKAPSRVKGTALSHNSILWQWQDNASDEDGFRIYGQSGTLIQTMDKNSTSFTQTGLRPATSYTITVKAYNSIAEGKGAAGRGKTARLVVPKPTNVIGTATSASSITWSWSFTGGLADKIRVYTESNILEATLDIASGQYVLSGLTPNKKYTRYFRAYNSTYGVESSGVRATATTPRQ